MNIVGPKALLRVAPKYDKAHRLASTSSNDNCGLDIGKYSVNTNRLSGTDPHVGHLDYVRVADNAGVITWRLEKAT